MRLFISSPSYLRILLSLSAITIAAPRASAFSTTPSLDLNTNHHLLFHGAHHQSLNKKKHYDLHYSKQHDRDSNLVAMESSSSSVSEYEKNQISLRRLLYNLTIFFRKLLFPHTVIPKSNTADPATTAAPLPDGTLGCPLFGHAVLSGDSSYGPGKFWREISIRLKSPAIFKVSFLGKPMAVVSGMSNAKNILDREFKSPEDGGIMTGQLTNSSVATEILGSESLLRATDKGEHSWLRKLVGKSMSPSSVAKSIPQLVQGTDVAIAEVLQKGQKGGSGVVMEDICTKYTLDVAWRQILGLDLTEEEIPEFRQAVDQWIFGFINPLVGLLPSFIVRRMKSYKARKYLDALIIAKIDDLKRNGPDGSTLSAMVFAKDDEDDDTTGSSGQKLTQGQIIDNALLLILAGSETSASTLTTAMLFLGMYPDIYKRIQEEQQQLQNKYGHEYQITRQMLDEEMPLLEAFIRETMRIKPLNSGAPRITKEAIVVDGKQIPKDWSVMVNVLLTHTNDPKTVETDGENNMDIYKGFSPERWLSEDTKPSEWVALGYGPRYCLGANLAMAEMKIFLSLVARNIEFSLVNGREDIKWQKMSIIPKPKDGTLIYATKKN